MFKKLIITSLAVAAGVCLATGQANAASVSSQFFVNSQNLLSDNSAEKQNVDLGTLGVLDMGDTLRGILQIQTIENQTTPSPTNVLGTGGVNELTAIFEVEVVSKTATGLIDPVSGAPLFNFEFGPNAAFIAAGGFSPGTMIALYEDAVVEYTRTFTGGGATTDNEALVTDGTLVMEWGFGLDDDEFWAASGAPESPGVFATLPIGFGPGTFNLGLSILSNNLGIQFGQVTSACALVIVGGCPAGDGLVDVNGFGGISGTSGAATPYDVYDDINFTVFVVPEPGTLGLLGIGLIGLGALARRRLTAQ